MGLFDAKEVAVLEDGAGACLHVCEEVGDERAAGESRVTLQGGAYGIGRHSPAADGVGEQADHLDLGGCIPCVEEGVVLELEPRRAAAGEGLTGTTDYAVDDDAGWWVEATAVVDGYVDGRVAFISAGRLQDRWATQCCRVGVEHGCPSALSPGQWAGVGDVDAAMDRRMSRRLIARRMSFGV